MDYSEIVIEPDGDEYVVTARIYRGSEQIDLWSERVGEVMVCGCALESEEKVSLNTDSSIDVSFKNRIERRMDCWIGRDV